MNDRKILENVVKRAEYFRNTPIVQDDFVLYRDAFDGAIENARQHLRRLRPKIVCVCGSTRFGEAFRRANLQFTVDGYIVLTVGCDTKNDGALFGDMSDSEKAELKRRLDELHKRKIDMADSIFVLNVGGYIGESTRSEIDYAVENGVEVEYLEEPKVTASP